jgi:glutathione S-transferase
MNDNTPRSYQAANSPNARRVRIFLAEKGLDIPLILVDLGKAGQRSECIASLDV